MSSSVVQKLAWLAGWLRRSDPLHVYIGATSVGIVWVGALGWGFYRNPLTDNQTSVWGMFSFDFIRPWMKKHPVGAPMLKLADLPKEKIAPGGRSHIKTISERFMYQWERRGRSSSSAIARLMLPWWTFTHVLQIPRKFVQFLPPMLVSHLLNFLEDGTLPMSVGYKLMLLAALRMICDKAALAQYIFSATNEGTQPAIIGCQTMILQKLQTMSPRARCAISSAEVQTIFAKMETFTSALTTPGQARMLLDMASLPLGYFFLYRLFGFAAIGVSIVANLGITALTARMTTQKSIAQAKLRELAKKQEALYHELVTNLPIVKLYGWSKFFTAKLDKLTLELERQGRWTVLWQMLAWVLPSTIGPSAVLISVGINVLLGGSVELVKLLTAGSYISIITWSMTSITYCRQQWKDLCVECKNIDQLLELPDSAPMERTPDGSIRAQGAAFGWPAKPPATYTVTEEETPCKQDGQGEPVLLKAGDVVQACENGEQEGKESARVRTADGDTSGWVKLAALKKMPEPKLSDWPAPSAGIADVDLHIEEGELVLISGPVAGGKSTLLQSLVGNTEQLGGELSVPQSVAFQPQSPILFDQTIRANILFGISEEDANEEWIQKALEASTLSLDMDDPESTLHAKRELTAAGQKGSELSGGQQARVALARCIYASLAGSECSILDDPLKALDPATAAKCWERGVKGTMAGKTRVLVVNSQMLQRFASDNEVSRLIIIERNEAGAGHITYNGKPSELPQSVQTRLGDGYSMSETRTVEPEPVDWAKKQGAVCPPAAPLAAEPKDEATAAVTAKAEAKPEVKPEVKKKEPAKGSIPGAVVAYCKRMGPWIIVSAVGMIATQAAELGLYGWYEHWAKDTFRLGFRKNYLIAIGVMIGAQVTRLFQGITDGAGGESASKSIRLGISKKLNVLGMPYLWDPAHSTAQLEDTVSSDPDAFTQYARLPLMLSSVIFSLSTVLYAKPLITPVAVACLVAYKYVKAPFGWGIRQVYGGLINEVKIGMRKFSGEVYDATPTIVAMGRQPEWDKMISKRFYERFLIWPLYFGALGRSNFYGMAVDTAWAIISMGAVISMRGQMSAAVAIAVYNQLEEVNSLVGFFFSEYDSAAQTLPDYMKIMSFLEVKESVGKACIEDDARPAPAGWPADGAIEMADLYFDYQSGAPCALNGVSVTIKSGENIGICGRTGAGKSTLLSVLFSLGPLNSGSVKIGGEDIKGISCHEVRANVAIVPQSPTLFDGTVRENLVGGNRNAEADTDEYLLETLRTCRLEVLVERGLDGTIGQLSDGQRQLFCVARALVRRPKILVLDESTADLDQDSANELLRVIDDNFKATTVISIAHRLNFIKRADRILVLNTGGTVNAFDTPANLLKDKDGYFARQMAAENSGMQE